MAQRISAGRGIRHSELNASGYLDGKKLRVVQAWLPPDDLGAAPSHDEVDLNDALTDGTLVPVASGTPGLAPLTICLLYTSPSPRDRQKSRMPSSA